MTIEFLSPELIDTRLNQTSVNLRKIRGSALKVSGGFVLKLRVKD